MHDDRPSVKWPQLCAIATDLLSADPTIDNLEWSERIKDRVLRLGYTYPESPDAIHRAMRAVERRVGRQRSSSPPVPAQPPEPGPLTAVEAPAILRRLLELNPDAAAKLAAKGITGPPRTNRTAEQIAAYRAEQFGQRKGTHRKTARGWVRVTDDA